MRLRNKIIGYMLPLILAPFLLTALAAYYFFVRADVIASTEEKDQNAAETVAELRKELRSARKDLALLKGVPAVVDFLVEPKAHGNEAGARTAMKLFFDQNPYYLDLRLFGRDGAELAAYSRLAEGSGPQSVISEDFFRRTLISGSVQSPVRELGDGKKVTVLTERIVGDEFLGVVVLSLNTEAFGTRLRSLLAGEGLSAFLFDDSGMVFASALAGVPEEECVAEFDLAAEAARLLGDDAASAYGDKCEGYSVSVFPAEAFQRTVYEPQAGENWFLGVIEKEEVSAATRSFQIVFLIALLLAGAAVLFAATEFARKITVPLEQFDRATKQVAKGDLDIDLEVRTGDEVEDLAATFRTMAEDLRDYQERLIRSAKLATIGELTSEISHEIQNRISGISLWIQYLDSEIDRDDPRREYLEEIQRGLEGFLEMLANLKQYYRTPVLSRGEVNIGELVRGTVPYSAEEADKKRVAVTVEDDGSESKVNGDPELLRSVLLNLILNAVEAVDEGGHVSVAARQGGSNVSLTVTDDGCGINEEDRSRIFYPFFSTRSGGSGLGLAIASNIVAAHGGSISVDSAPGGGSAFTVLLPAANGGSAEGLSVDGNGQNTSDR
ncbi:MAG: sensor histidine kinase [Acidobacteriota bacterium]|nr:MAG: sensor histidine kinase [Acidobacteriota bacterium]